MPVEMVHQRGQPVLPGLLLGRSVHSRNEDLAHPWLAEIVQALERYVRLDLEVHLSSLAWGFQPSNVKAQQSVGLGQLPFRDATVAKDASARDGVEIALRWMYSRDNRTPQSLAQHAVLAIAASISFSPDWSAPGVAVCQVSTIRISM